MTLRHWFAGGIAVLVLAFPSITAAQQPTVAELEALIAQLQALVTQLLTKQTSPSGAGTLPGLTLDVAPYGGNAYTFVATIDVGNWTGYSYEIDWGEGDGSRQTNRSRVVTVCNSPRVCDNPPGVYHEYAASDLYTIRLYAIKETSFGTSRWEVASAQARASVPGEGSAKGALSVHEQSGLGVVFRYTMNVKQSCAATTYALYFGDEDLGAGEEPQYLNDSGSGCNAYVQYTSHTYEEAGTYEASLYDVTGGTKVLLAATEVTVGDGSSGFQFVDIDLKVNDDAVGTAPFTTYVTTELHGEKNGACPVDFPPTSLTWGDGRLGTPSAQAVTTYKDNGVRCGQKLTATYTHTYTTPGTYTVTYRVRNTAEKATVVITVKGKEQAQGTVNAQTYTTSKPTLTGSANVSPVGISISSSSGDKVYGSGITIVPTKDQWSHTVSTELASGTYGVKLYYHNGTLAEGKIAIKTAETGSLSCSVTADAKRVLAGDSVTLTWTSKGASYGTGPSGDKVDPTGSATYTPEGTSTYTFTFFGPSDKPVTCSTTVFVTPRWQCDSTNRLWGASCPQPASAYSAIASQLKEISRLLEELF